MGGPVSHKGGPVIPPLSAMSGLDVEADVQDVAVPNGVGLALESLETALRRLGVGARLDEVLPVDHLAPDEPAGDIAVDRRSSKAVRLAEPRSTFQSPGESCRR